MAEHLQQTNELLQAIKDVQSSFIARADATDVFQGLLRVLVKTTQSEYGFLDEVHFRNDGVPFKRNLAITNIAWDDASRHLYEQLVSADFAFSDLQNLAGAPVTSGQIVIANAPAHDPRARGIPPGHPPVNCFLGIPLYYGGEIVGVAGVANRQGGYSQEQADFLEPLATTCAGIIASLRSRRNLDETHATLQRSEERYRILVENCPFPVVVTSLLDNTVLFANPHAEGFFSFPPGSSEEIMAPGFWCETAVRQRMVARLQQGERVLSEEVRVRTLSGEERHVLISVTRIDYEGKPATFSVFSDITERKRAEVALQESEGRVQAKLAALLSPEGDLGELALADIIDISAVQAMMDDFYRLAGIGMALVDCRGKVLVSVGWQEACTQFHRVHPVTCQQCIDSHMTLSVGVNPGEFRICQCKNNLWTVATPIVVGDKHLGSVFLGQFFFDDTPPDYDLFRAQARQYGFEEKAYLAALDRLPRWSRQTVETAMQFFVRLGGLISLLSYSNLKLARLLEERKRTEEALRDSEALLNRAEEIDGIGSFIWDLATDRMTWSKGAYALSGLEPNQDIGNLYEAIARTVHPEDRGRLVTEVGRMVVARRVWPVEFRLSHSGRGERLIRSTGQITFDAQGLPVRCVGTLHDITDQRESENRLAAMQLQLHHASRLATLGELAAGVAHEVNQPLCAIVNFSKACKNLASSESADLGQIREWSEAAATTAAEAGEILRRMLRFAHRSQPEHATIPVRELVTNALLLVDHEARVQKVTICLTLDEEDLAVYVQAISVQQVLVNLLRNSIDALKTTSSVNRQVVVRAKRLQGGVQVSVADNGPGLAPGELERIFGPFFTTKSEGLGLGLAISRTIVEEHGGQIWATAHPDGGLTVHFTLPRRRGSPRDGCGPNRVCD